MKTRIYATPAVKGLSQRLFVSTGRFTCAMQQTQDHVPRSSTFYDSDPALGLKQNLVGVFLFAE